MRRRDRPPAQALLSAALAALLTGCAQPALDLAPPRPDRPWQPSTNGQGEIVPGKPAPVSASSYVLPANPSLGAVPAPPTLDSSRRYTLPELVDIAQSSHPETRIAWNDARNAALAAGIAQSAYLPRVTASVVGGHTSAHGQSTALGDTRDTSATGTGTISALSLQWLLFDFGQREATVEAAQQVSVASNIAFTAAHQRIIHAVCVAFYALTAAQAQVETAEQSLRNALDVAAAAAERYKRGIGTVIEVNQARQASAQARLGQVRAKGGAQDAYLALVSAMGISPLAKFEVADVSHRALSGSMLQPVQRIVSDALARRPDVLAAYAAQKASAASVRAAEADFRPKVFMSATGSYNSGHLGVSAIPAAGQQQAPTFNVANSRWGSNVIVGVTVPLYDGRVRDSVLMQAQANADKAAATLDRVREEAVRQIVSAQNTLETSLAAHDASIALMQAAQTGFDAALDAYRRGVGSITAATVAQTQLLQAQAASNDAHSAALAAAATLAFATGALGAAPP
jgi:outer membrane protein TolC